MHGKTLDQTVDARVESLSRIFNAIAFFRCAGQVVQTACEICDAKDLHLLGSQGNTKLFGMVVEPPR